MKIQDLSVGTRLVLGFSLKMAFAVIIGLVGLLEIGHISSLTERMYDHPLTVGYNMRDIKALALEMHDILRNVNIKSSPEELDAAERRVMNDEDLIEQKFAVAQRQFLGDKSDAEIAHQTFEQWKPLREEKFRMLRGKRGDFSGDEFNSRLDRFTEDLTHKIQVMIGFASDKAASFLASAKAEAGYSMIILAAVIAAGILFGLGLTAFISRGITKPMGEIVEAMGRIANGDHSRDVPMDRRDEIGVLAEAYRKIQLSLKKKVTLAEAVASGDFSRQVEPSGEADLLGAALARMTDSLRRFKAMADRTDWIKTGLNELSAKLTGELDARTLAGQVLGFLVPYLGAQIATLYLKTEDGRLVLVGSYAFNKRKALAESLEMGQGLVGQAALEGQIISVTDIPEDYLRINSSFGDSPPRNILALPLVRGEDLIGVMELGSFTEFSDKKMELLDLAAEPLAAAFDSLSKQAKVRELLNRTQTQAGQLQQQEEELRASNEDLEEQAQALRQSEEELRQQQEELQVLNEELEEKNTFLEEQKSLILSQNQDLDRTRQDLERKAQEVEVASRYKSEFLANMSHELRTPLNSLLILSRSLSDNDAGRLSAEDVESAEIIYKNGHDLLNLINDILDLSKIEAGKMTLELAPVPLRGLTESILKDFKAIAESKNLILAVEMEEGLPAAIRSDSQRLEQILRNLLSNALKFTDKGSVVTRIHRPRSGSSRLAPDTAVAFSVIDTGIGIPADKQSEIFEAFRQADGSTARRYGGTGLGLSITRELSRILGGEISLLSSPGAGSTFTVTLPEAGPDPSEQTDPVQAAPAEPEAQATMVPSIPDDREQLTDADKTVLIIEDDPDFAGILANMIRAKGFKVLAAATGEEGLKLAEKHLPLGVLLDVRLPGINGWTVLGSLKDNHLTRHIPVHVISAHDDPRLALNLGAVGFFSKPTSREELDQALERIASVAEKKVKDLLLVEDNPQMRRAVLDLVGDLGVKVTQAETGTQALEALATASFDCMVLDLGLPDMSGLELLKRVEQNPGLSAPPVIVYTGRDLTKDEEREISSHAESIIIKGARSEDRLLDEVTLFLHRMVSSLPRAKQRRLVDLRNRDAMLEGKKILVVDDDMRNLFAIAKVLEDKGLLVVKAEDGNKALSALDSEPRVDLVLLDIMMPGMDGYETLRRIRAQGRFAKLPVIALTAKAMREDREKCLAAGANDYLAKPLDLDKLLSMMRVWLYGK